MTKAIGVTGSNESGIMRICNDLTARGFTAFPARTTEQMRTFAEHGIHGYRFGLLIFAPADEKSGEENAALVRELRERGFAIVWVSAQQAPEGVTRISPTELNFRRRINREVDRHLTL